MAAPSLPCTYKSVTLVPGEQFNLPPGAVIIGASNVSAITSTCPLPDPSEFENLGCYGFITVTWDGNSGADTEVWEDTQTRFTGVVFNGQYYSFSSPRGYNDSGGVIAELQNLPFGGALSNFCTSTSDDTSRDSNKTYYIFNTYPSIANNLELWGTTTSPNDGSGLADVPFSHPCQLYSDIIAQGNGDVCSNCVSSPSN